MWNLEISNFDNFICIAKFSEIYLVLQNLIPKLGSLLSQFCPFLHIFMRDLGCSPFPVLVPLFLHSEIVRFIFLFSPIPSTSPYKRMCRMQKCEFEMKIRCFLRSNQRELRLSGVFLCRWKSPWKETMKTLNCWNWDGIECLLKGQKYEGKNPENKCVD